jgi:uncharacterized protein (TIGR03067 family)
MRKLSMLTKVGMICAVVAYLAASAARAEDKAIEGRWKLVGVERAGVALPKDVLQKLPGEIVIAGVKIRGMVGDKQVYEADFKVDTAGSPKSYEMSGGKDKKGRDIVTRGIYEIDAKGQLRKCFVAGASGKAPLSFNTKDNPGSQLLIYERVK